MTIFDVLRRPLITEKTSRQSALLNQYAFEVELNATKDQIRDAIEVLFDVEVENVNVMVVPAKRKRVGRGRRVVTRRKMYKKAVVTLAPGQTIDVFEGIQ